MDPLFQTFGEQVRRMRLARRLTQDALAERAELTPKYVSEIENGHVNPSLKVIHAIAVDGLGVSVAELFAGPLALSPARPVVAKLVASLQSEPVPGRWSQIGPYVTYTLTLRKSDHHWAARSPGAAPAGLGRACGGR
ncbi:MAG: helix-turn-helix domain-containing protein [Myxococcota bacterium]